MTLFHDPATFGYNETSVLASAWTQYPTKLPEPATRGPRQEFLDVPLEMAMIDPDQRPLGVDRRLDLLRPAYEFVEKVVEIGPTPPRGTRHRRKGERA